MFNDIKVSVKLIGCIVVISVLVTAMMLTGAKIRMDTVRGLDSISSIHRNHKRNWRAEGQHRETGWRYLPLHCSALSTQ